MSYFQIKTKYNQWTKLLERFIVIKAKYKWNLYLFLQNFLTIKDSLRQPYIKAHDTEYYGREKAHILREKKKKIINIKCGITHWNWLRLAFRMTKTRKLPGLCPRTPVRPKWVPPRAYLSRNMGAWRPFEFSKICTCHNMYFEIKKKKKTTIGLLKVRQATKVKKIWVRSSVLKSVPAQGPTSEAY